MLSLELYRKMLLIRFAEEKIIAHYHEDEMKTPMHMSMGEEAIAVGMCHSLLTDDQITGTFRSHAIYIAKTGETECFFAEMYGKETGMAKGKSGSMHLSSKAHGIICASAIVASSIPVALGAAFANQYMKNDKVVAAFFGDGALEEGVFWETLNMACVQRLPIIFVCENNGYAVHEPWKKTKGYQDIGTIAQQFECDYYQTETTDVEQLAGLCGEIVETCRATKRPAFLQAKYYRYLEHVGIQQDFDKGYRSETEYQAWLEKDPILLQKKRLLQQGISESDITMLEHEVMCEIDSSIWKARQAPFAPKEELYKGVFQDD